MWSSPSEEEPSRARKLMPLFVVAGAAAAGALAIWIAVLINRPAPPEHVASSPNGESKAAAAAQPEPAAEPAVKPADRNAPPALNGALPEVKAEAAAAVPAPTSVPAASAEGANGEKHAEQVAEPGADTDAAPTGPESKREAEAREKRHAARAAKAAVSKLPASLSREDVLGAMSRVHAAVVHCVSGAHAIVTADMKIEGSTGRVMSVNISGAPGPAGSCIAGAVRKARFPLFSTPSLAIRYPMKL